MNNASRTFGTSGFPLNQPSPLQLGWPSELEFGAYGSGDWEVTPEFEMLPETSAVSSSGAGESYVNTSTWKSNPLQAHGGTGANLLLRWNNVPSDARAIDVVVHLHGFIGQSNARMLRTVAGYSGLDLRGRVRPTLGILPRGRLITPAEVRQTQMRLDERARQLGKRPAKARSDVQTFPGLLGDGGAGLESLITGALQWFAQQRSGGAALPIGRLILTAHSGGGGALDRLVASHARRRVCNPDEVHAFDALYSEAAGLKSWVTARLAADRSRQSNQLDSAGGALRVFYRPDTGTQPWSGRLGRSLPGAGDALSRFYRIDCTQLGHFEIPKQFGPPLLRDRTADLSSHKPCSVGAKTRRPASPASSRLRSEIGELISPGYGDHETGLGFETLDGEYGAALNVLSPSELKAVKITSTFETGRTGGFGGLSGNFDGQGLSFGLMNFTIQAGSLIPLLKDFISNHPSRYAQCFGPDAERFKEIVFATKPDPKNPRSRIRDVERQMEFVNNRMNSIPREAKGNKIIEPWKTYFGRLETDPEFQKIQVKVVRGSLDRARYWSNYFGFKTERGFAFMFDLVSSHGGAWLNAKKFQGKRRALLQKMLAAKQAQVGREMLTELQKMEVIANMIADVSSTKWREKVRIRKLWFVRGSGKVHGTIFDIKKDFGVTDNAPDFGASGQRTGASGDGARIHANNEAQFAQGGSSVGDARIIDLTARADKSRRLGKPRDPKKVYALVLHQMACCFKVRDPLTRFLKMAPHFAILPDGRILQLHPILSLTAASNGFNPGSVAVEFAGNFPDTRGKWWHGPQNGQNQVTPQQIEAGRYLVKYLIRTMGLKVIVAHRQSSGTRDNDPGPDIWYQVGQWAIDTLGLSDGGPGFKTGTGKAIPDVWRTWGKVKPQPEFESDELRSQSPARAGQCRLIGGPKYWCAAHSI